MTEDSARILFALMRSIAIPFGPVTRKSTVSTPAAVTEQRPSEIRKSLHDQDSTDCARLLQASVVAVVSPGMMSRDALGEAAMQLRALALESPRHADAYVALATHFESYQ